MALCYLYNIIRHYNTNAPQQYQFINDKKYILVFEKKTPVEKRPNIEFLKHFEPNEIHDEKRLLSFFFLYRLLLFIYSFIFLAALNQ